MKMESIGNFLRAGWLRMALGLLVIGTSVPMRAAASAPPLWVEDGQLTKQARQLLTVLQLAEDFGLSSLDYHASLVSVEALRESGDSDALEQRMTAAASRFVRHLHDGRVDPRAAGYALKRGREPLNLPLTLRRIAAARDVSEALAALEPRSSQYRVLKQTLARYRRIRTDLPELPALPQRSVKPGDLYAGSAALRERLAELGDVAPAAAPGPADSRYDAELAAGVARFQRRHGLTADGLLGAQTFAALAVPVHRRIRQIELTLERWRWMPDLTAPAVIVNVPQYMLYTLPRPDETAEVFPPAKIPVIVGQSARQTPIFDSAIESVVFRPYWNVPDSILREELLPLIVRDADYLARHDMEIVRGAIDDARVLPADATGIAALRSGRAWLRQRPGPNNALGLIKFVLPNPYSVYLHSTPEAQLFGRDRRALSHGCIRVSDASALAAYLLEDNEGVWDVPAIEAITCATETFEVRLATPVPVFILYGTVVVDTDGEVLFFEDVYGYDRRLDAMLVTVRAG
jgi:murein L,D-transpeptidase YcbB/YkuD